MEEVFSVRDCDLTESEEPKLYAKTLIALDPTIPSEGPGIPAGVIVEVTQPLEGSSRLVAHWNGIHMDVDLWEIDPDC
jgi:hypothetical protein